MKSLLKCILLFYILIPLVGCESENVENQQVDLNHFVNHENILMASIDQFKDPVIMVQANKEKNKLEIYNERKNLDWINSNYLVCDVYHENNYSAIIYFDFYKKDHAGSQSIVQQGGEKVEGDQKSPRLSVKIGVLPNLKTRVIFPLSHLDGQKVFLDRQPRQLKGTIHGRRIDKEDIGRVVLRIEPVAMPDFQPKVAIGKIFLSSNTPEPLEDVDKPIVDKFGQWSIKDWSGKIYSEDDLKKSILELEKKYNEQQISSELSRYGGWKKLKFDATGFFTVHHDGNRWWFVDPEGYAFLSTGSDCIRNNSAGVYSGQRDLFSWLPNDSDSLFNEAFSTRGDLKMYDFIKSNLMRIYGSDYQAKWENLTASMIKDMKMNTIANWSDIDFARNANIPYVLDMKSFPSTKILLYRDFPDVFSDEYLENAKEFAKQMESFKEDKYLIGYFLRNEPLWAFGENNLAFEMMATATPSVTKSKYKEWLQEKYKNVDDFNKAWNLSLSTFDNFDNLMLKEYPSESCRQDCWEFSGIMVDQYVKPVCDEVRKVDPNHLNLGLRYAWISSDLCYRAGTYFDVFSINGYSFPGPPNTEDVAKRSGKPVLIGEYHFGSIDKGLPSTGIQGVENQKARGEAYRYYLEQGFARPELIGIHYFQWYDQPVFGRYDGENYNIGFVDITLKPYEEMVAEARKAHERMYSVAIGEEKPFDKKVKPIPQLYF